MLHVTFSNRSEALLDALVADMGEAPASPFVAEHIIVPTAALRRVVTLALAQRRGICANVQFSFLAEWLWRQMAHFVPLADASPFAAPALVWRVRERLDDTAFAARLGALRPYVDTADPLLRYELARQIAALLETYVTYRPQWLARWSAGDGVADLAGDAVAATHEPWQAALWRQIATDVGVDRQHPSFAFFAAIERLGPAAARRAGLPERAYLFALSSVPPLYLRILARLACWIDLRLYVLNPCRAYWYEIVDRRRLAWLEASGRRDHHETGNELLAGWGRQTRAFVDLLLSEAGDALIIDDERFVEAPAGTVLGRLQNAMLDLVELDAGSLADLAGDRSVEVHVCHSLARQLEALRDQLLALFDSPDPPQPAEVLVLLPDLETAAPLIEAVFGSGGRPVPFAITGRAAAGVNPVADLLLRLLALPATRLAADEVFDLLQHPLIGRRLRLDEDALLRIHGWMHESGMRWGLDAAQRGRGDDAFSLRDGLRRLLLGHALPAADDGVALWAGVLPTGEACGSEGGDLGRLWQFVEALATTLERLRRPRPATAWPGLLHTLLADWIDVASADDITNLQSVRAAIDEFAADLAAAGASAPLSVEVVGAALAERLEGAARGGVPTGAVTFTTLAAARGLSARIVCLLGLDDGVFPRPWRPAEFDLMVRRAERGDRQCRDDDRNLLLDIVLGARDRLQFYYTGRSSRDNGLLPPALPVSELLDRLAIASAPAGADADALKKARAKFVVEHPLQSFSLSLFQPPGDPRRPSYDARTCAAWRQALAATAQPLALAGRAAGDDDEADEADEEADATSRLPFFTAPLPPLDEAWRCVALTRLCAFFRHPARVLLKDRLQIDFEFRATALPDDDPFDLAWSARRQLWSTLLPARTASVEVARAMRLAPAGGVGDHLLADQIDAIRELAARIEAARRSPARDDHALTLELAVGSETWQVHGQLADLHADGQILVRADDAAGREYLDAWLRHLVLNICRPAGVDAVTTLIARNGDIRLPPVATAAELLAGLLALYRDGLRAPLHFYPRSAWAQVEESPGRARAVWSPQLPGRRGEGDDPWWRLALRGVAEPLDERFVELAQAIYGPLRAALNASGAAGAGAS